MNYGTLKNWSTQIYNAKIWLGIFHIWWFEIWNTGVAKWRYSTSVHGFRHKETQWCFFYLSPKWASYQICKIVYLARFKYYFGWIQYEVAFGAFIYVADDICQIVTLLIKYIESESWIWMYVQRIWQGCLTLQWRHNEPDGVSIHWRLFFTQPFVQAQIKENLKAPRHWHLWKEFYRWSVNFPHKRPVTRKYFHLMTPSSEKVTISCIILFCTYLITACPAHFLYLCMPCVLSCS